MHKTLKLTYKFENRASQWDLVCDNKYLASLATTIYFSGVMVGGLLFGFLSDFVGRLPILLFTLYLPVAVGVGTAFAHSYVLFVTLRFIQGVLMQGLQTSSYVLAMEFFIPAQRPMVGAVMECFWGATVMLLPGLAYLLPNWRHLQLAISLPSILAVFYIWNIGMGTCLFWARLGGVIAPQINRLGIGAVVLVPILVFGCMMLLGGALLLLLPETHGHKLPDTIDDVEQPLPDANSILGPTPYVEQELMVKTGDQSEAGNENAV
nr:hypothetical protein BaRGS_013618 [Batillaria attramentaria]